MIERISAGFTRAADTAEYIAVHHFWPSVSVIGLPVLACVAALVLA
jgi:hypothetical protein